MEAQLTRSAEEFAGPQQPDQVDDVQAQLRALGAKAGVPADITLDSFRRSLRQENQETRLRPDPCGLAREIIDFLPAPPS